ncbi:MAG: putative replicase [Cressdnaviricota sp.]|nr:MAG: putative replicase [Cressdnaviricota sp.]
MAYPWDDAVRTAHICQHTTIDLGSGKIPVNAKAYKLSCCNRCVCEGMYNEFFVEKPTNEEVQKFCQDLYIKGERAKQYAEDRRKALFNSLQESAQIITINFDKGTSPEIIQDVLQEIANVNYNWLASDAIACIEFFSSQSPDKPENPHVHIATKRQNDKNGKPIKATNIAQQIRRKYKNLQCVYGVNGQERTWNIAKSYVDGSCASKSDGNPPGDKWVYTEQDIKHRLMHDIPHPISMKSIDEILTTL